MTGEERRRKGLALRPRRRAACNRPRWAELPPGSSSLGPWLGSREGDVASLKPHYRAMLEDTGL